MRDEVAHQVEHFLLRLAEADHDAALGAEAEVLLRAGEHVERALVVGLRADAAVEPRDRLDVVVEEVGPRLEHDVGAAFHDAAEVGDEDLDGAAGDLLAEEPDRLGEDRRAAVLPLVAVHARHDDVLDAHEAGGLGDAARLVVVEAFRRAGRS